MCIRSYLFALRLKAFQAVCLFFFSVGLDFSSIFTGCLFRLQNCSFIHSRIIQKSLLNSWSYLPDGLPASQYTDTYSSDSRSDSSRMFQQDASHSKPHPSHRPTHQTNHYPQDVQSDQLQRGVVLGPPGSPQGVKSVSQAQKDDRLKQLEKRLEELALMIDMVKTQVHIAIRIYDFK